MKKKIPLDVSIIERIGSEEESDTSESEQSDCPNDSALLALPASKAEKNEEELNIYRGRGAILNEFLQEAEEMRLARNV